MCQGDTATVSLLICHSQFQKSTKDHRNSSAVRSTPCSCRRQEFSYSPHFRYLTTACNYSLRYTVIWIQTLDSCLNTWSLSGGTVLGDCGTFQGWSQTGGIESLRDKSWVIAWSCFLLHLCFLGHQDISKQPSTPAVTAMSCFHQGPSQSWWDCTPKPWAKISLFSFMLLLSVIWAQH